MQRPSNRALIIAASVAVALLTIGGGALAYKRRKADEGQEEPLNPLGATPAPTTTRELHIRRINRAARFATHRLEINLPSMIEKGFEAAEAAELSLSRIKSGGDANFAVFSDEEVDDLYQLIVKEIAAFDALIPDDMSTARFEPLV